MAFYVDAVSFVHKYNETKKKITDMATEGRRPLNSFLLGDTNKGSKDLADAIACKRKGNTNCTL